mmetsp:Transcript_904/g.1242  ORF Transcript_904/g.1242 Transcript_904/m.1242 type:complete len:155 (+) Transcript_904:458-922(+)
MNEFLAMGRSVKGPLAGVFKIRYPNLLFLTLKNQDEAKTTISKPIVVNYWIEPVDPAFKVEEYQGGLIKPEFVLNETGALRSKRDFGANHKSDDQAILLWVCFVLALLIVGVMAAIYCVMQYRKRKMQLQQALAEGKVSIKKWAEEGTEGREDA